MKRSTGHDRILTSKSGYRSRWYGDADSETPLWVLVFTIALHKLGQPSFRPLTCWPRKDISSIAATLPISKWSLLPAKESSIATYQRCSSECPTVEKLVSVGPEIPEGFEDFHQGIENATPFVRPPEHANTNDDISLMYFYFRHYRRT